MSDEKKDYEKPETKTEEKKDAGAQGACGTGWCRCGKLVAC